MILRYDSLNFMFFSPSSIYHENNYPQVLESSREGIFKLVLCALLQGSPVGTQNSSIFCLFVCLFYCFKCLYFYFFLKIFPSDYLPVKNILLESIFLKLEIINMVEDEEK